MLLDAVICAMASSALPRQAATSGRDSLHFAARTGDVARAAYLLQVAGADPSSFDEWQCQPLFYASLCGHVEMLRLLLRSGARVERNTFDGERCLYAALNDACRTVLLKEGFGKGNVRADDAWLDVLENSYDNEEDVRFAPWREATFELEATSLHAHTSLLAARVPYLATRFLSQLAERQPVTLSRARFPPELLSSLLRWAYTGRFACAVAQAEAAARLLAQCGLPELADAVRAEAASCPPDTVQLAVEPARGVAKRELQSSLLSLLDAATDSECSDTESADGRDSEEEEEEEEGAREKERLDAAARRGRRRSLPPAQLEALRVGSVRVRVGGRKTFHVPPALLAPRSEYWAALFARWSGGQQTPPVEMGDVSVRAFRCMLRWAVTDELDATLPPSTLLELLSLSDRLLIEPLMARVALALVPAASRPGAAVPLLSLADRSGPAAARLAAAAASQVALQLEALARDEGLRRCVAESAASVRDRQAADSIPVLDEIAAEVRRLHGEGGELSDEEEEEEWGRWAEGSGEERRLKAEAQAAGAGSERRRKTALLALLAAGVQGWEVAGARRA